MTIAQWRTYTGAEYQSPREIPCFVITNRYLIDSQGNSLGEEHPALKAEIERRGRDTYRDHGYGQGHSGVPVAGCHHA